MACYRQLVKLTLFNTFKICMGESEHPHSMYKLAAGLHKRIEEYIRVIEHETLLKACKRKNAGLFSKKPTGG